jgi:hypothetical protein
MRVMGRSHERLIITRVVIGRLSERIVMSSKGCQICPVRVVRVIGRLSERIVMSSKGCQICPVRVVRVIGRLSERIVMSSKGCQSHWEIV